MIPEDVENAYFPNSFEPWLVKALAPEKSENFYRITKGFAIAWAEVLIQMVLVRV